MVYLVPKATQMNLLLPLFFIFSVVSFSTLEVNQARDSLPIFTYNRLTEIKHQCATFLPVVLGELKPAETLAEKLKNELSFINGDWSQETNEVHLIPSKIDQMYRSSVYERMNVVSFWVMDVGSQSHDDNMVSVSGIMEIGFTKNQLFSRRPDKFSPDFETSAESTKLSITFEGVYMESKENGGVRHMCLLGTSWMPNSDLSPSRFGRNGSSFGQDSDQIMLRLRYPKTFTLTSRVIHGEMQSLATKSCLKDFGTVSISSQLNEQSSTYKFGAPQELNPRNDSDIWFHGDSKFSGGRHFCRYLEAVSWLIELKIILNHKVLVQNDFLRAHLLENERSEDFIIGNLKFVMRNLICKPGDQDIKTAKLAAEFKVWTYPSWFYRRETSGLSGGSVFAEGFWNSTEKDIRMVGCLGGNGKNLSMCDYQVSIYFPTAFSIHRRSTVYGSIKGINGRADSDATVTFENVVASPIHFIFWNNFYTEYEYLKISLATSYKSRLHQLASPLSKLKNTLLKYPSYDPKNHTSLSFLGRDLTVFSTTVNSSECAEFEILFAHLLFVSEHLHISPPEANQGHSKIRTVAVSGYLNVQHCTSDIVLSMEGLYDPTTGTMHLIGCRELRALPVENINSLEQGLDCMIEVEIKYPPMNIRWLMKQKLKISISSQREKQDSLYFSPIVSRSAPVAYHRQIAEDQFEELYEIYLRFILLICALFCSVYQLRYMTTAQGETSKSYISLVMLYIQFSGYILFFNTIWSYETAPSAESSDTVKVLPIDMTIIHSLCISISSEFITIARQVWKSRSSSNYVNDIRVLMITLSVHVVGLSIFFNKSAENQTTKTLQAYWDIVLDLFLLPQVIVNTLHPIRSKPLRKIYYIGFSLIRTFPHLYNYFRFLSSDADYMLTRRHPYKVSDIVLSVAAMLLVLVVYIQQRRCLSSQLVQESAGENESLHNERVSYVSN